MILDAWHLGNLVDKIQDARWNCDDFFIHDFEQFTEKQRTLINKIDGGGLFAFVVVDLLSKEVFHFHVIVFTEQLEESEYSTKSLFVIDFGH